MRTTKLIFILAFLLCAFPAALLMALITPLAQVPDEPHHLARAISLLEGKILSQRQAGIDLLGQPERQTGFRVDAGLYQAVSGIVTVDGDREIVTQQDLLAARAQKPDHGLVFVNLPNTATYFPAFYVPAALGLALGLAVHASPYASVYIARLAMLAAFLGLGTAALWVTAFGEAALLSILLLPMTLFLAGSVSQDAVLVAAACLAAACLTRGTPRHRAAGLALLVLVLGSKPPYLPLLAMFLLPLARAELPARLSQVALAAAPVVLWAGLVATLIAVPYPLPPYHPGPAGHENPGVTLDHADPAGNFHALLAHPAWLLTLPWHTLRAQGVGLGKELIGVLGLLTINLPKAYYVAWFLAGGCAFAGLGLCKRREPGWRLADGALALLIVLASYWLLLMIFYVNFTESGRDFIDGIQGRYTLPLLPFLLFAVPALRLRFALPAWAPAVPVMLLGLVDIGYLPLRLMWSFYLH